MYPVPKPLRGTAYPYDPAWRQLHEVDAGIGQVVSLVAGATLCMATFMLWIVFVPFHPIRIGYETLLLAFAVVLPTHELSHVATFLVGRPRDVHVELVWQRHRPSLRYRGTVSRARYIAVLAAPVVVVSLAPIAASVALSLRSGDLVLVSMLNALVSGADAIAAAMVLVQVPAGALLQHRAECVIWRPASACAEPSASGDRSRTLARPPDCRR